MNLTATHRRVALAVVAVFALTLVYLVGATRFGAPARAADTVPGQAAAIPGVGGPGITVGASADVAGTPDTLRLDLTVAVAGPTVSAALAKANALTETVHKSLLANGVAKKDIQTSGLDISPNYTYTKSGSPVLKGYSVSESVNAKLRNLATAGDAIGKVVTSGGNAVRVNGISLDLEETGALVSRARDKAFADAKAKAEQYSKVSGRPLGAVLSIAEKVAEPAPVTMGYAQPAAGSLAYKSADVPIQPGSQKVGVSVTVVYAMR
jgi:uncharacterized protein YggE